MDDRKIYIDLLITALKRFSENPGAIDNLESYLNYHFETWAAKYANTPGNFISELSEFSKIESL